MVIAKGERVSLSNYPQNLQMVKCPKDMLHIAIDLNYGYFIDFLKENLRSKRLDHVLGRKYYRKLPISGKTTHTLLIFLYNVIS